MANEPQTKKKRLSRKTNKNYYISPLPEDALQKRAVVAEILACAAVALWIPGLILFIAAGFDSLIWLRESYEAQIAYMILFFGTGVGVCVCAVLSFLSYRIRKKVMQKSAPTLGFARASYNGIFITGVAAVLLFLFQIVDLIGYHICLDNGYIARLVETYADLIGTEPSVDVVGIIAAVLYAADAASVWVYYVYTFRVNKTMQLVCPDGDDVSGGDAPAVPSKKEAEAHRPLFRLSKEEKERGKREFEDFDGDEDEKKSDDGNDK